MRDPLFDVRSSLPRPSEALIHTADRAVRLRLSCCGYSRGMFVDDLVGELTGQGLEESAIRWAIHEGCARAALLLAWRAESAVDPPDGSGPVRNREGQYIKATNPTPPCAVDLSGPKPRVFGIEKNWLPPQTRKAVEALLDAYPGGLTTKELTAKFAKGDKITPPTILRNR